MRCDGRELLTTTYLGPHPQHAIATAGADPIASIVNTALAASSDGQGAIPAESLPGVIGSSCPPIIIAFER